MPLHTILTCVLIFPNSSASFTPALPRASATIETWVALRVLRREAAGPESSAICSANNDQNQVWDMRLPLLMAMPDGSSRSWG